jgi:hypothetical protein
VINLQLYASGESCAERASDWARSFLGVSQPLIRRHLQRTDVAVPTRSGGPTESDAYLRSCPLGTRSSSESHHSKCQSRSPHLWTPLGYLVPETDPGAGRQPSPKSRLTPLLPYATLGETTEITHNRTSRYACPSTLYGPSSRTAPGRVSRTVG